MAYPTIFIDSTDGVASDSAASGAGPATAITGTAATSDVAGTTVTLDGSPDLSGVATDGSHALYLHETTAGRRCFAKITAVDNGAKTVTVSPAVRASIPGGDSIDWAIGGVRATLAGSQSIKLVDNNTGNGDAMPGWVIQLQDGHSETAGSAINIYRAGDNTSGAITLRGESGAATLPLITFTHDGNGILPRAGVWVFQDFELRNSNGSKTNSTGLSVDSGVYGLTFKRIKISHATNYFFRCYGEGTGGANHVIEMCDFGFAADVAIRLQSNGAGNHVHDCDIHDCGSHGILRTSSGDAGLEIHGCIFDSNGGDGINVESFGGSEMGHGISHCTFYNNTSDGIQIAGTDLRALNIIIENCIFKSNGGYGLSFSSSPSEGQFSGARTVIRNNDFHGNTSGKYNPSTAVGAISESESTSDPTFVDAANRNFAIGTNLKELGNPAANIGSTGSTRSYVDIGVAQRQESGGGVMVGPRRSSPMLGR